MSEQSTRSRVTWPAEEVARAPYAVFSGTAVQILPTESATRGVTTEAAYLNGGEVVPAGAGETLVVGTDVQQECGHANG